MPKRTYISRKLSSGSKWLFGDTVRSGKGAKPSRLMKSSLGGARKSDYRRSRRRRNA